MLASSTGSYGTGVLMCMLVLVLAIMLAVAAPAFGQVLASAHAQEKHGRTAVEQVRNCLSDKGAMQIWQNPDTGRYAFVCKIQPNLFGIQIAIPDADGVWQEITAFIKRKMSRIEQVEKYLENAGYVKVRW